MAKPQTSRKLDGLSDDALLDLRLCDLPIRVAGSQLEPRIERLLGELSGRGLRFKPHFWLSDEWFSPDASPGVAIPFYLAHPRLIKLERKQMMEAEGSSEADCMRILRHETGHAMDTAFQLHRRKRWRELFGSFTQPYPDSYKPRPNSRRYVLHLDTWYAQAHPAEDFAETFAVWLTPGYRWRKRYEGWPALEKLEYVDELMAELVGRTPSKTRRLRVEPVTRNRQKLRDYYAEKRERYALEWPAYYDRDLRRIFSSDPGSQRHPSAARWLRSARQNLCSEVAEVTGVHTYTINHVLQHMIERCKILKLRLATSNARAHRQILVVLTVHTMNVVHSGYYRVAI